MEPAGEPGSGLWPIPSEVIIIGRNESPVHAYYFLRGHALSRASFTGGQFSDATGWSEKSIETYRGKQLKHLLRSLGQDQWVVQTRFLRFTLRDFLKNFTQTRQLVAQYERSFHRAVVSYEFLLPLTRERELRNALDSLFFKDSVSARLGEVGSDALSEVLPMNQDEHEEHYMSRVIERFGRYFGGYSIVHVEGRFRASDALQDRSSAAAMLSRDERYLIDETTASVRFIVPCTTGTSSFGEDFGYVSTAAGGIGALVEDQDALSTEVSLIRELFFSVFVEAVADTVRGEDQIWLIETTPTGQRLFKWTAVG